MRTDHHASPPDAYPVPGSRLRAALPCWLFFWWWAGLSLIGCGAASIEADMGRVRELTRVQDLAAVHRLDVDPVVDQEVQRQLAQPLDVDAAVRVALLNNRELRASLRELGIARGQLLQAGLLPNPLVEAELFPERNTEVQLRVEYAMTRALLTPARARVARADLEAARFQVARRVVELGYRVRAGFYMLQATDQRLAVAQRLLDTFAAGREAAHALFEAGNIPAVDLAMQEAAYQRTRVTVAQIELEVADQREAMQRLLGLHGRHTRWQLGDGMPSIPEPTADDEEGHERRAILQSLELAELRHRLEATARRAGYTRLVGALPDVALDVHALYGDPTTPRYDLDRPWRFGAGVSLTLPMFDRQQGLAMAQDAEFDALLERYYGTAIDVRSAARDARNRRVSAEARARQYANVIVPAQQRVTEETLRQYNAMQISVFELLQAQREQLAAELAFVDVVREYWTAEAALEAIDAGTRPQTFDASGEMSRQRTRIAPLGGH